MQLCVLSFFPNDLVCNCHFVKGICSISPDAQKLLRNFLALYLDFFWPTLLSGIDWKRGESVSKVTYRWSHGLATPWEFFLQIKVPPSSEHRIFGKQLSCFVFKKIDSAFYFVSLQLVIAEIRGP